MFRPLLSQHYSVWVDPPDEEGDEVLHVVSEQRSFKLKGFAFREFRDRVLPLLDGEHTVDEIVDATSDVFHRADLVSSLTLLADHGVLVESAGRGLDDATRQRLAPQLNLFHELVPNDALQDRLSAASAVVIGLGGTGSATALALAAAGVGRVGCVDWLPVAPADSYLGPAVNPSAVGLPRAQVVAELIAAAAPGVQATAHTDDVSTEGDLHALVEHADIALCCLDAAQANTIYKLNRVCLSRDLPWIIGGPAGLELAVGPVFIPGRTACYLCYRMRSIACAGNPEDAYRYERRLDARKHDDSGQRANLVFGAGVVANLLALEAVKMLSGVIESALVGRLLTVRMTDLAVERHTVLRKPWCPACYERAETDDARPPA